MDQELVDKFEWSFKQQRNIMSEVGRLQDQIRNLTRAIQALGEVKPKKEVASEQSSEWTLEFPKQCKHCNEFIPIGKERLH